MLKIIISLIFAFSNFAIAEGFDDIATITSSKPIYKVVKVSKPVQHCYQAPVQSSSYSGDGSATNELVGGLIGGAIGNQFGKGRGKDATTVIGALLGASIANDRERNTYYQGRQVTTREVCETRYSYENREQFSHYLVKYNYKGTAHSYKSSYKPASTDIDVRVFVSVPNSLEQ